MQSRESHLPLLLSKIICFEGGGAVAEWCKILLVRENERKTNGSQVSPTAWVIFSRESAALATLREGIIILSCDALCSNWLN